MISLMRASHLSERSLLRKLIFSLICRRLFTSPKINLGCTSPKINLRCTSPKMNLLCTSPKMNLRCSSPIMNLTLTPPPNPEAKSWVKTLHGLNFRISFLMCVCVYICGRGGGGSGEINRNRYLNLIGREISIILF